MAPSAHTLLYTTRRGDTVYLQLLMRPYDEVVVRGWDPAANQDPEPGTRGGDEPQEATPA